MASAFDRLLDFSQPFDVALLDQVMNDLSKREVDVYFPVSVFGSHSFFDYFCLFHLWIFVKVCQIICGVMRKVFVVVSAIGL